jgi:hypothetical protein
LVVDKMIGDGGGNHEIMLLKAQPANWLFAQLSAADFAPALELVPV